MLYIGIDPGVSGAIAMIDGLAKVHLLEDWPGDEIRAAALVWKCIDIMEGIGPGEDVVAAIEKVHAIPMQPTKRGKGMSSTSSFTFGANFGVWRGILAAVKVPFEMPAPQTWQKGIFTKADGKDVHVAVAGRLFPKAELIGPRGGKKDGRADALLIANWRRKH